MSRWLRRLLREDLAEELSPDASPDGILEEREEAPEALPDLPPTADLRLVVEAAVPEAARADLGRRLAALQSVVRGVLTLAGLKVREVRVEACPTETPDPSRPSTWADLLDEEEDARDESAREESLQSPTGLWRALDLLQVEKGRGPTVGRRHSPAGGTRHLR